MKLLQYDDVDSTMEIAHALAQDGAVHGTCVVARSQSAGRGQRGRPWDATEGGLWCSVVARPDGLLGLDVLAPRVGLAVALAVEEILPAVGQLGLKWPNDLQWRGRKLGGVLCEARWSGTTCQWVVIGIGINVRNVLAPELATTSARLAEVDPLITADLLAPRIAEVVTAAAINAGPLEDGELMAWSQRDVLAGRRLSTPVEGTGAGIQADGALLVRTADGHLRAARVGVVSPPE